MNKQKILGVVVIIVLALLVLSAGVVSAVELVQGGPPWLAESEDNGEYFGPMHGRRGRWSSEEPFPPMHDLMVEAVAEVTGLTTDEIEVRLAAGERMISIALDAGLTETAYFDLMNETRAAFLAEAVEAGWITQDSISGCSNVSRVTPMSVDPAGGTDDVGRCNGFLGLGSLITAW